MKFKINTLLKPRFSKFIFVGVINNFIGYLVYVICLYLSDNTEVSLYVAYGIGIVINFNTFSQFVFSDSPKKKFIYFLLIYLSALFVNNISLSFLVNNMLLNSYLVQFILAPIFGFVLYFLNKNIVFNVK